MEARYLAHPNVPKMIRLAIRRARKMFDAYPDIDDESLYADMLGELGRSFYNPTKSQPGTFAYRVAWCRLRDISRKRSKENHHRQQAIESGEFTRGGRDDAGPIEEIAAGIYASVKDNFSRAGIPIRSKHCGKPYLDRIQRIALYMLQQRMGWSCREAESVLRANPTALLAMGVSQTPDHNFFWRIANAVSQLTKLLNPESRAA